MGKVYTAGGLSVALSPGCSIELAANVLIR